MPLVSVVMPSYNHSRFVRAAIDSVLGQTVSDFEFIIIDDSSLDDSRAVLNDAAGRDKRIRLLLHEKNEGIARTLNEGMEKAAGRFIAFIASDDVWARDKLERQLKIIQADDDRIVWSEGTIIDKEGAPVGNTFTARHGASGRAKTGKIFEELLRGNFIFGSSLMIKRDNLKGIRFDEDLRYLNDYRFFVDLAGRYEYHFIEEPTAMYRIHGGNAILSDAVNWHRDNVKLVKYFLTEYSSSIHDDVRAILLRRMMNSYLQLRDSRNALSAFSGWMSIGRFSRSSLRDMISFVGLTSISVLKGWGAYLIVRKALRKNAAG